MDSDPNLPPQMSDVMGTESRVFSSGNEDDNCYLGKEMS